MRHEPNIAPMVSGSPEPGGLELNFDEAWHLIRSHWRMIATSVIACLALAGVYLIVTPAQYTATSLLLIESRPNVLPTQQLRATDANAESAHVETQVEVLRSERIARAVISSEGLTRYPEFAPGSRGLVAAWWPFEAGDAGEATSPEAAQPAAVPAEGQAQDAGSGGVVLEPDAVPGSAVKAFNSRLNVKRNSSTHIIEISFRHSDPALAARIANAVSKSYLSEQLRQRDEIIRSTSQWLRQRALELLGEAHAAETALIKFRSSNAGSDASSRIVLRDLETTAQTYRWFSETFQKRFLETSQSGTFTLADARVVSEAWPPTDKSHPKRTLVLAIALAAGLSIGFLAALARGKRGA